MAIIYFDWKCATINQKHKIVLLSYVKIELKNMDQLPKQDIIKTLHKEQLGRADKKSNMITVMIQLPKHVFLFKHIDRSDRTTDNNPIERLIK